MKQAVILVGGKGSRISKITVKTPKPLIKVYKLPFVEHLIKNLSRFGIQEILLLCHYKHNLFFKKYHNKKIYNISIKCILEKKPSGTGGAIYNAKKHLKDKFLLLNGDTFFDINIKDFINFSINSKKICAIALRKKKFSNRYHGFTFKKKKIFVSEKYNSKNNFINSGIYLINKKSQFNRIKDSLVVDSSETNNILNWDQPFSMSEGLRITTASYLSKKRKEK